MRLKSDHTIAFPAFLAVLVLFLSPLFWPAQADAQQKAEKQSTSLDVAFTFYKMAGGHPDFHSWVLGSESYQQTRFSEKDAYLDSTKRKLAAEFRNFKPGHLVIETEIRIKITKPSSDKKDENLTLTLLTEEGFFSSYPYKISDQWIMVVIPEMENNLEFTLKDYEAERIEKALFKVNKEYSFSTKMTLVVDPVEVDAKQPFVLDGIPQWLIRARPAAIRLSTTSGEYLWEYQAPWYVSPVEQEVHSLFRE